MIIIMQPAAKAEDPLPVVCVCRHMLSTLCSLCKSRKLAAQVRLFI